MKQACLFLSVALLGLCGMGFAPLPSAGPAGADDPNHLVVLAGPAVATTLNPGDRVVLLAASGDLSPGHAGTVICKGTQGILVSWDRWFGGNTSLDYCTCSPLADFLAGSAKWMSANDLGLCIDVTGTLVRGVACVLFQIDSGQRFLIDAQGHALGERLRVQGLLRCGFCFTPCAEGDGCITHVVTSAADAGPYPCCDPACLFRPGDRVVLLDVSGMDATSPRLQPGASGIVLRCGPTDALVSWDMVMSSTLTAPDEATLAQTFQWPAHSLGQVALSAIGKYTDLGCTTVTWSALNDAGRIGAPTLYDVAAGGRIYTLRICWVCSPSSWATHCLANWMDVLSHGANVHLRGLIGADLVIDSPLLAPCDTPPAVCCGLKVGDRVVLLVDTPPNLRGQPAFGLYAGALGTVMCCDSDDPTRPLFVSWDNWAYGTNNDGWCDTRPGAYAPYSGWWVQCSDVRLYSGGTPTPKTFAGCGTLIIASATVGSIDYTYLALQADTGEVYALSSLGGFQLGDRVWVEGQIDPTGSLGVPSLTVTTMRACPDSSTCKADLCQYEPVGNGFSPASIRAGQTLLLRFGAANCGTASIPANWQIRFYASPDTTITAADYLLDEGVSPAGLAPGQQFGFEREIVIPSSVPAGQYYIGWIFDPANQICESNENNNAGYIKGTRLLVQAGSPSTCTVDFCQYDAPTAGFDPTTIQAGTFLNLELGVANCGTTSIAGGWKIRYYASQDTTITSSDYFLYETTENPVLPAGMSFSGTESFRFPTGVPAGQYYIGWIFDPDNQICESNENNNVGYIKGKKLTVASGTPH